ncbi:hypothetical protein IE81DRAFT_347495 [Ceraceosorus guamensis]|uniref:Protein kinase domain-containing protein n=1 Tax=Ceraceosorus guamensis TaxID=1522189 RepID=A0A316W450_9BASI|nr:hypothetical protein IE81DRAFT_347495 [Ceraceosorus guamensis]PWN42395.1 hypothetical protein IE81DRAFT_347495 [Ceraceosorus guamensis]
MSWSGADAPSWRQPRPPPSTSLNSRPEQTTSVAAPQTINGASASRSRPSESHTSVTGEVPHGMPASHSPTKAGWRFKDRGGHKDSDNWRAHPSPSRLGLASESANSLGDSAGVGVGSPPKARQPRLGPPVGSAAPATPLNPLLIRGETSGPQSGSASEARVRPLAHPSLTPRLGGENWALTPSSSLPSLPGSPRTRSLENSVESLKGPDSTSSSVKGGDGRPNVMLSNGPTPDARPPSRNLEAARAQLQQRTEAASSALGGKDPNAVSAFGYSYLPRQGSSTQSPKGSLLSLANESASNFSFVHPSSSVAPSAQLSLLSPRAPQIATPPLGAARRGSTTSNNSPTSALNGRPSPNSVLHSRHSSGAMPDGTYSPAGTTYSTSSHSNDAQPRRLYRPPHLRNRSSAHSLRPTVAHYDRVRTPSLRGQSRSPEPGLASSRSGSRPPSTIPLSPISNLSESMGGLDVVSRRRMGSIGSFSRLTGADTNSDQRPSDSLTLGDILATRLAQTGFEDSEIAPSHPADLTIVGPAAPNSEHEDEEADDVSLNAEDMMAMSERSITDRYCFSRDPSSSHALPPVDIFEIGDRLGPGMLHDGQRIRIAETSDGFRAQSRDVTGSQLEVVRKLGEGSYATVYLVEEVAPLPLREVENEDAADFSNDKEYSGLSRSIPIKTSAPAQPQDPEDDTYSRTLRASDLVAEGRLRPREHADPLEHPVLGRQFALKCLCKRDLNEESLEIQRLEATIHQSIPPHPHIVTLYRTYETDDWLFLVLEYCPGQDLFYWLEQAHDQDTYNHEGPSSERSADGTYDLRVLTDRLGESSEESSFGHLDGTPPSPSLLASTAGQQLLSRRRLRLVSRMFGQMCDAVQFCHDRGISHRDLKPENFIVEDRRESASQDETQSKDGGFDGRRSLSRSRSTTSLRSSIGSRADADARIIVKLTDFGLAVAQERCVDFDCGSKPYMAYECHNNVADWYDPMQADTWSLGIVLLNLLFHRSPFGEPSPQGDPAFASFCYDPVAFLTQAFEGLTVQVAEYVSDNVLCDVTNPKRDGSPRRRVTPRELGIWALKLPEMLSADKREHGRSPGARTDLTSPLEHSRSPLNSGAASLFGSPWATPSGGPSLSIHESLDANGYGFYPSLFPEYPSNQDSSSFRDQRPQSVRTPSVIGTPESLPSPTFSPPRRTLRLPSVSEGSPLAREAASAADAARPRSPAAIPLKSAETANSGPQSPTQLELQVGSPESPEDSKSAVSKEVQSDELHSEKTDAAQAAHGEGAHDSNVESLRPVTASNPKRRKRGARKGRTAAKLEKQQHLKRSQSAENLASGPAQGEPHPRDALLAELAAASQTLAREMSRNVKKSQTEDASSAPQHMGAGRPSAAARSTLASRAAQHLPPSLTDLAARPNPPMFLDKVVDSPGLDAASVYSSVGSRASTAYTNFSWNDRARPFSTLSTSTRMTDQSDSPAESERHLAKDDDFGSGAQWDSAAARRDRINAERGSNVASTSQRGGHVPFVEDARKSEPSSWRDRNPSTASVDTTSSASSLMSDAPSSIYSTTSAPAAILGSRRSTGSNRPPSRSLLGMTAGLDPIAERKRGEKAAEATAARLQPAMDASYLPAIFGANPKAAKPKERRKESGSNGRQPSSMTSQPYSSPSIDDRSGYAANFAPNVSSRLRPSQDSYTRPPPLRPAPAPVSSHGNANGSDVDRLVNTRGVSSVASTTAVTPMTTSASYSTPSFDAAQSTQSPPQNIVKSGMSRFFSVRNRNG